MANKLNTLRDALDAAYPIPDTPHESVKQRARESRTAFIQGWQSCVASTALQAPVREVPGWQLVPIEPTHEMVWAARAKGTASTKAEIWSAMLAAAPLPAAPVQEPKP